MNRLLKQLLYGALFLIIIGAILWPGYRLFVPAASCTDGIQNQQEEGVDCGAICGVSCPPALEALTVEPVQLLPNADGSWDAIVQLKNPNTVYGASRVDYRLDVLSDDGGTLVTRRGNTYVNSLETHHLVFALGSLNALPANATFSFDPTEVRWVTLSQDAVGQADFTVRSDVLRTDNIAPIGEVTTYQANALNRSHFDFDTVDVVVLVEDAGGNVVAAGSTVMRTVVAGEERGFTVDWPFAITKATRARAYITTNLFSNDNYIREYGTQGRVPGF